MDTSTRISSCLALALLSLAACGDDSTAGAAGGGSGGGPASTCGTLESPEIFQLADVTPAPGSVAEGLSVVHSFRVVDAPALVNQLAFRVDAAHTAGAPTPPQLTFAVTQEGSDLVYTATAVEWANAGHVELSIPTVYEGEGCAYAFPAPIFSYDVAATEGSGGAGGTGSTGTGGSDAGAGGAGE